MNPEDFELSLQQQFELCRQANEAESLSRDQLASLLLDSTRLLMIKDNVIRSMAKRQLGGSMLQTIANPITED